MDLPRFQKLWQVDCYGEDNDWDRVEGDSLGNSVGVGQVAVNKRKADGDVSV